jgi:aspartyl-tRNA(Asn)/glutamyl-tRNA(Gln) amidotransferase subunit C
MGIERDDVRRIAELARLEVPEERLDRLTAELSAVLDYADALRRLDLTGCEPMTLVPTDAPLRDDVTDDRCLPTATALAAAPESEGGFFLVPPVVENVNP